MIATNSGSAREIEPGRLAGFEDAADLDFPTLSPPLSLPPRRPARSSADPSSGHRAPSSSIESPTQRSLRRSSGHSADRPDASSSRPRSGPGADGGLKEGKGPEDRVRPSNVHIPVALLEPLEAKCKENGLSHGEVIIVAIENAHPRLRDLVHPAATAGGSIFASRRSRASRSTDGPLTPLNYRLREADFETLDHLVEEFGASSRGHLITAALNDYFGDD